mgnify:CR=1 FL=1
MIRHLGLALCGAVALVGLTGGCNVIGYATNVVAPEQRGTPVRKYENMAGQTALVMVWTDYRTKGEYPNIRAHLGEALQNKLQGEGQQALKAEQLKGTRFPYPALSVVQFQDRIPGIEFQPAEQVALRFDVPGLSRLIYVELSQFDVRPPGAPQLLRGTAQATLKVVEIQDRQTAKVVFSEALEVKFPASGPDLMEDDRWNPNSIYQGTLAILAHEAARRFYDAEK